MIYEQLYEIIRGTGYVTRGQTHDLANLIVQYLEKEGLIDKEEQGD